MPTVMLQPGVRCRFQVYFRCLAASTGSTTPCSPAGCVAYPGIMLIPGMALMASGKMTCLCSRVIRAALHRPQTRERDEKESWQYRQALRISTLWPYCKQMQTKITASVLSGAWHNSTWDAPPCLAVLQLAQLLQRPLTWTCYTFNDLLPAPQDLYRSFRGASTVSKVPACAECEVHFGRFKTQSVPRVSGREAAQIRSFWLSAGLPPANFHRKRKTFTNRLQQTPKPSSVGSDFQSLVNCIERACHSQTSVEIKAIWPLVGDRPFQPRKLSKG